MTRLADVELLWEKHPLGADGRKATREDVMRAVCAVTGIKSDLIKSTLRKGSVVRARFLVCYLARRYTVGRHSLAKIGQMVGGRNHATVLYAVRKVEKEIQEQGDAILLTYLKDVEEYLWGGKDYGRAA